jgi:cytoskeletal protein CcmA (bactofilin family)
MFNKENVELKTRSAQTIIGPSIKVKGNFHGEGSIIIEGELEGSIKTNDHLLIGDRAKIIANVEAKDAKIGGLVNGNIKVQGYLEISSTAKITGDVEASLLSIEKGAILNGKCSMSNGEKQETVKPNV